MDKSPLEAALNAAEADGPDNLVNLLAMLLMAYHDFDRLVCAQPELSHWSPPPRGSTRGNHLPPGVNRKNKGYFEHVQYLAGVP